MTEFELIRRFLAPLSPVPWGQESPAACQPGEVIAGQGDDCALMCMGPQWTLALSVDTQVEGRHFPAAYPPEWVASRSLAAAVSDLAAMGAEPLSCLLALTLPRADEHWLAGFAGRLGRDLRRWHLSLMGGDTTAGPLVVSFTVLGRVPSGQALTRHGARVDDDVWVSGTLGDAAAGLHLLQARASRSINGGLDQHEPLLSRYHEPEPRLALGQSLRGMASACIDVSDGLVADLGHLCEQSRVGAVIELDRLPLSTALTTVFPRDQAQRWALGGGDDYELCFTAPVSCREALQDEEFPLTRIGRIVAGERVIVQGLDDAEQTRELVGFDHFRYGGDA